MAFLVQFLDRVTDTVDALASRIRAGSVCCASLALRSSVCLCWTRRCQGAVVGQAQAEPAAQQEVRQEEQQAREWSGVEWRGVTWIALGVRLVLPNVRRLTVPPK